MRVRPLRLVRLAGRLTALGVVACVMALVTMQFEGVVAKNFALAHDLSMTRADIEALRARKEKQSATILRLSDPRGAIPEIHDKMHLVGPREEIFYVRGAPKPTAAPGDWTPVR